MDNVGATGDRAKVIAVMGVLPSSAAKAIATLGIFGGTTPPVPPTPTGRVSQYGGMMVNVGDMM